MRCIFIDLGAYSGDSIKWFLSDSQFNPAEFEIYGFEVNPLFERPLMDLAEKNPKIQIKMLAAWTHDGEMEFAVDKSSSPQGSTLMHSKAQWKNGEKIKVKCFDFSEWIRQFAGCFVVVKMDIEGAEFPVLEKMLKDDTVKIISLLMVEFHHNKVTEYSTTYKNELLKKLMEFTTVTEWH